VSKPGAALREWLLSSWRGLGLVAITYVYFLIFAQFGFLHRLDALSMGTAAVKLTMSSMALGGMIASLCGILFEGRFSPAQRWIGSLAGCSGAALLSILKLNLPGAVAIAALIGVSLGLLTVTLVTHLQKLLGSQREFQTIGAAIGLAYATCNYPPLFSGSTTVIALAAASLCLVGFFFVPRNIAVPKTETGDASSRSGPPFLFILACFTGLVWLDSAAFYIIQNSPGLRAMTWSGSGNLLRIGGVHVLAAMFSACLLARRGLYPVLLAAFACLSGGCLALQISAVPWLSSCLYPAGVSFYSVALVAYPAFMSRAETPRGRAAISGILYAVAGWVGSALGIGMAEHLHRVPATFVGTVAIVIFLPFLRRLFRVRRHELIATTAVAALGGVAWRIQGAANTVRHAQLADSAIMRGRSVYISEGCIHCHSQYIRPHSADEEMWGGPADVDMKSAERPPLIGNRRQGPDLSRVGSRRSAGWLREHFMDPAGVSFRSPMPSYAYLFRDSRGDDLIAYLLSLKSGGNSSQEIRFSSWRNGLRSDSDLEEGVSLLEHHCLSCHFLRGKSYSRGVHAFRRPPPDLAWGPFVYVPFAADSKWREDRIAEIIKFGLPNTDMAGHEYFDDRKIALLTETVASLARGRRP
jgi:cbb3-type cytochrome oxidase cytochrome c subunit